MHIQESLEMGGLENGVVNISNNLDVDLFKTTVCCINRLGRLTERIYNPKVSYFSLKRGEGKQILLPVILRRLIRKLEVDIVHTHNFYSGLYGIIGAKLSGRNIRIIHGEHGMFQHENRLRIFLGKKIYSLADKIITVSKRDETFINGLGIPPYKTRTILNGVDLERFDQRNDREKIKRDLNLKETQVIIGCVGRLSTEKGHHYLLRAMKSIASVSPDAHLVVVGDGPLCAELTSYVIEASLVNRIHFLGNRQNVHEIYPIFDIFVLPSLSEGLSNVLLEAMACRLPVIATDIEANRQILTNNKTALLVQPASEASLADAMRMLLSNSERRKELGIAARAVVEQEFSLSRMVHEYAQLYTELALQKRRN